MRRSYMSRLALGVCLPAVALVMACSDDTATVLDPLPNRAFNFVLTREGANVPRGSVILTRDTSVGRGATRDTTRGATTVEMRLQGLELLRAPYFYQAWIAVVDTAAKTISGSRPLVSRTLRVITTDTTISPDGDFIPAVDTQVIANHNGSFNFGGPGTLLVFNTDSAAMGEAPVRLPAGRTRLILITIDSNPASLTLPDSVGSQGRLWARNLVRPAAPAEPDPVAPPLPPTPLAPRVVTTPIRFGNFHVNPAQEYIFLAAGRGRGSVLEGENVLVINDSSLSRPPRGYYYATSLVTRVDGDAFNNVDTIQLGPQTAPYPDRSVSLFRADSAQVHPVVQVALPNPQIFAAQTRIDGDSIAGLAGTGNPFRGVALVLVTLENKLGIDAISPVTILAGAAPAGVRLRD